MPRSEAQIKAEKKYANNPEKKQYKRVIHPSFEKKLDEYLAKLREAFKLISKY